MATIRENKTTKTKSIANKIVNYLKNSKYLHFEEVEDYPDGRVRIRYDFNNDLINQARDSMKEVLQDVLIDIFIEDYDDYIEVSIGSLLSMNYDDWFDSLKYTNDDELYDYLEEQLGDEALLDNAQNNDTWEENLKEDLEVQNQHNKKKDIRKVSKQDLVKATINELNEPQDDLDFFVKQKLIKNVDDFKKANKEELAKKMVNNKMPYVVMLDKDNDFAVDLSEIKNLKEDMDINQSSKGLNKSKKIVENKIQESRDFHNYKTKLEKAKTKDELIKIWNAFRKDYDSEMTPNEEKTLGELYKDLRKELKENWIQFKFEDGSNPYIAKTKEEQDKMFKKYKDRIEQVGDITYLVKKEKKLKEDLYNFSKADKKAIIQWWKDVQEAIGETYVDLSTLDNANEDDDNFFNWFSAMYDVLNDLRYNTIIKDDDKKAYVTNLYRKGKRLYNKYALSQFNESVEDSQDEKVIRVYKLITKDGEYLAYGDTDKYFYNAGDELLVYNSEYDEFNDLGETFEDKLDYCKKHYSDSNYEIWVDDKNGSEHKLIGKPINYKAWGFDEYGYKLENYNENLNEAKGKLDDALPELKDMINEHKNSIIEYGEALKQGNVTNPNYNDYTTRFVFDIYYFLKRRGFNIYKYIDENDLRDDYIKTLMKKALSECGIKITLEEDLDTFNDKMDFLAKDEDEAIDGYKKVIKTIDNKNVKTQLGKIEKEEKAHKDYLEKVKKNKNIKYTEPLMDEE